MLTSDSALPTDVPTYSPNPRKDFGGVCMDYLKVVKADVLRTSTNAYVRESFDSNGCLAKFKVVNGTLNVYSDGGEAYAVERGEIIEFVGKLTFYGNAEIQYILFDKV